MLSQRRRNVFWYWEEDEDKTEKCKGKKNGENKVVETVITSNHGWHSFGIFKNLPN